MSKTKEIALIGVYVALLIGGQVALSAISGIEVVTVLLASFAFYFGIKRSLIVAVAFSILRCFLFGFMPSVIILYLIYYPLFVTIFGLIGNRFKHKATPKHHVLVIMVAVLCVVLFTALDNLITPLYYGFDRNSAIGYATTSLYATLPQVIFAIITLSVFFRPLLKLFEISRLNNQQPKLIEFYRLVFYKEIIFLFLYLRRINFHLSMSTKNIPFPNA